MEKAQMLAVIPEYLAGSFLKHLQPKHTEIMDHNPKAYQGLSVHQPILDHHLLRPDSKKEMIQN